MVGLNDRDRLLLRDDRMVVERGLNLLVANRDVLRGQRLLQLPVLPLPLEACH